MDVDRVFGASICDVEARLYDLSSDVKAQVTVLDHYFMDRLAVSTAYQSAFEAAQLIQSSQGLRSIESVSAEIGYSLRTVDRIFRGVYGLSPKFYARVQRLNHALRLITPADRVNTPPSLTEIALACGYYDQAHFTRDFKSLVGQTPAQYLGQLQARQVALAPNLIPYLED